MAFTLVLSRDEKQGNVILRNWEGGASVLLSMASVLLGNAVQEATKARNLPLANRIDAALESLGDHSVIRSTRVVSKDDL